jgi:hypothetical protein
MSLTKTHGQRVKTKIACDSFTGIIPANQEGTIMTKNDTGIYEPSFVEEADIHTAIGADRNSLLVAFDDSSYGLRAVQESETDKLEDIV